MTIVRALRAGGAVTTPSGVVTFAPPAFTSSTSAWPGPVRSGCGAGTTREDASLGIEFRR